MPHKFFKSCRTHAGERGFIALLFGLTAVFLATALSLSVVFVFLNRAKSARTIAFSYETLYAAESGIEDILLRFYDPALALPGTYPSILQIGNSTASTTLTTDSMGYTTIRAEGIRENQSSQAVSVYTSPKAGTFNVAAQIGDLGLTMDSNSIVNGNVYSNGNITGDDNTEIQGNAYAVGSISSPRPTISGARVQGAPSQPFPVIDTAYWKARANINNDPIVGNTEYSSGSVSLGPRKIVGNLSLSSNLDFTVTGPIHITGNLNVSSNVEIFLSSVFAASSTVIIVGGEADFSSNSRVYSTTSTPNGYLLVLSESTSTLAIDLSGNSCSGSCIAYDNVFFAPNGTINISSNAEIRALTAKGLSLNSNAYLEYNLGLQNISFSGNVTSNEKIISWQEQ